MKVDAPKPTFNKDGYCTESEVANGKRSADEAGLDAETQDIKSVKVKTEEMPKTKKMSETIAWMSRLKKRSDAKKFLISWMYTKLKYQVLPSTAALLEGDESHKCKPLKAAVLTAIEDVLESQDWFFGHNKKHAILIVPHLRWTMQQRLTAAQMKILDFKADAKYPNLQVWEMQRQDKLTHLYKGSLAPTATQVFRDLIKEYPERVYDAVEFNGLYAPKEDTAARRSAAGKPAIVGVGSDRLNNTVTMFTEGVSPKTGKRYMVLTEFEGSSEDGGNSNNQQEDSDSETEK